MRGDPKYPCKFVKKKNGKNFYTGYRAKTDSKGRIKYREKVIKSVEDLDNVCNAKPVAAALPKMASKGDPEADKDDNEVDVPAGGKLRKNYAKNGTKEMMWKAGGTWMDMREYLEYVASRDPHNSEKYWKTTQKNYRFRKSITASEI